MFNFWDKIFGKVISLVASAIIAVGIVSVPEPAAIQTPQIEQPRQEIVSEQIQGSETEEISNEIAEQIKEATKKDKTQTISQSQTASVATILPETQEPSPSPTPDSTPTPTSTSTPTPTPESTTEPESQQEQVVIEISSININTTLNSVAIEWKTNIPTNSKIFISGSGISSKVYSSQSGLSTRHIASVTGLSSNTTYSYEIEAIIDNQVVKKQGSFSTKPDEYTISLQADKTSTQASGWNSIYIYVRTFKNGELQCQKSESGQCLQEQDISVITPDSTQNVTQIGYQYNNGEHFGIFAYYPKTIGTNTLTFSWNGVNKNIDIQGTEYIKINPEIVNVVNSNCNPDCSTKPVLKRNTNYINGKSIVSFSISEANPPTRVGGTEIEFESDIKEDSYFTVTCEATHCGGLSNGKGVVSGGDFNYFYNNPSFSYFIMIWNTKDYVGSHTFTIKSIKTLGRDGYYYVSGLPITFTFEITE